MVEVRQYQGSGVARPQRVTVAVAPESGLQNLVPGLNAAANQLYNLQDEIDTADAQMADNRYSDLIRETLYSADSGFMYSSGGDAVKRREDVAKRLEAAREQALSGLSPMARQKADQVTGRRYQSALQTVDGHAADQSRQYLNDASEARLSTFMNDAIFNPDQAGLSLARGNAEIAAAAARNGWAPEVVEQKRRQLASSVHGGIIDRLQAASPMVALDYLAKNKDQMDAATVVQLEGALAPAAKAQRGRVLGQQAAGGIMPEVFNIAADTLGMDENAQRETLQQYLADGGVNLDPSKTAWCAAYVNATLARMGVGGTSSLMARSFLEWGQAVDQPQRGDVVVMSRGDPNGPSGHVGFFDGFNEDGTIRVLGGNQGDAVSLASFDPSKVLGFRRAGEGQGVAGGMQAILAIEDPDVRDAALAEFKLRASVTQAQADQQRATAADQAFQLIEAGGSVDDLTIGARQSLGRESMSELRTYEAKIKSGGGVQTDQAFYADLVTQSAVSPDEFMRADPVLWRNKLADADFQELVKKQADLKSGRRDASQGAVTISSIRTASKSHLEAAGIKAKEVPAFESSLLRWAGAFQQREGREPNAVEMDQAIKEKLAQVVIGGGVFGIGATSGPAFSIEYGDGTEDTGDDILPPDLAGGRLKIGGEEVPEDDIREFGAAFEQRFGRLPTAQEIVDAMIAQRTAR